jgi:hypothetical protein
MPGHGDDHTAWGFLDRLYRAHHIKRQFDAVGLHPYSPQLPDLPRQTRKERRVMKMHHDAHTPCGSPRSAGARIAIRTSTSSTRAREDRNDS